ncbi:MAG: hypothetical protein GWP02_00855 [Desulfobulbaceae bacterium]|nr:hypothetical protein [Desulfobulbaceae bacterium]
MKRISVEAVVIVTSILLAFAIDAWWRLLTEELMAATRRGFWNRTALEQIKNSGALRQMNNQQLAEKISAYEAYEDAKLSLLTDDLNAVKIVVNSYLVPGGYYGIRPRAVTEMPRLEANARELIELLKQEYPQ